MLVTKDVLTRTKQTLSLMNSFFIRYPSGDIRIRIGMHFPKEHEVLNALIYYDLIYLTRDENEKEYEDLMSLLISNGIKDDQTAMDWLYRCGQRIGLMRQQARKDPIAFIQQERLRYG